MLTSPLTVAVVFFRSTTLDHLDAALYSLARQNLEGVQQVVILDNNTEVDPRRITEMARKYLDAPWVLVVVEKHGDLTKTHSWSVNRVVRECVSPWLFFTRSDYILSFDCLHRMRCHAEFLVTQGHRPFVSGWCWQMAYDREARNIDATIDIEQYGWRERGMAGLLEHPYAFRFHETHEDAGVWLTQKASIEQAGGMNEGMVSWGYQQSELQRRMAKSGITMSSVPDYLFAHQHHFATRDFTRAHHEWMLSGGR